MKSKIIILTVVFIFSLFFLQPALADEIVDQQQNSSGGGSTFTLSYEFSQSFIPAKTNVSKIETGIYTNTKQMYRVSLYQGVYGYGVLVGETAYALIDPPYTGYTTDFIFSPALSLDTGSGYYFTLSATTTTFKANGAGNLYSNGEAYPNDEGVGDLYFKTYYNTNFIDWGVLWNIEMITPSENWLYNKMPTTMTFRYTNSLGVYSLAKFKIFKLSNKGGSPVLSITNFGGEVATTTQPKIGGAQIYLNPGYYQLYDAHFLNSESVNYITTPINFEVIATGTSMFKNASTSLPEILAGLNEHACDGIATSTDWTNLHIFGDIECGIRKAGAWLFSPSEDSMNSIIASFLQIQESFPFNAFFGITSAIESGVSTTSVENATFKIPFITATGTITTLPVMSSTSLSNLIGTTNNNLFRNSIIYFGWIICAGIIYFTIRFI